MITRRHAQAIARDWVIVQAIEERERRMAGIDEGLYEYRHDDLHNLRKLSIEMLFRGLYDPPTPSIPPLWRRLRMTSWEIPDPTLETWPKMTTEADVAAAKKRNEDLRDLLKNLRESVDQRQNRETPSEIVESLRQELIEQYQTDRDTTE